MYQFVNGNLPDIFNGFFARNKIEMCTNTIYTMLINCMYPMSISMLEMLVSRSLAQNCGMYFQIT